MKYISMFSGIEAATVAWHPLTWTPLAFAEIEPFPSRVLRHHYPTVQNVGDMTAHDWKQYRGECDLVVGGPPCQAFSVAGLRESLADDRGNLSLSYARAIRDIDPLWSLTENVPGWLTTDDNAFGCVLAGLVGASAPLIPPRAAGGRWTDAGLVTGPERTAAWRILDAQYFGLAQRRRRVFVLSVRGAGNWACARALFPLAESLRGDSPPRRTAGERATGTLASRPGAGGGLGTDMDCAGGVVPWPASTASTLNAAFGDKQGLEDQHALHGAPLFVPVTHALTGTGHDASEDGTGRGTPIVPIANALHAADGRHMVRRDGDNLVPTIAATILSGAKNGGAGHGARSGHAKDANLVPMAFGWQNSASQGDSVSEDVVPTLDKSKTPAVMTSGVRRLTPVECSRLQGFPDQYCRIPLSWHKARKITKNRTEDRWIQREDGKWGLLAPDGPIYKALGNSMAVPVMAWVGRRIALVDAL